MKKAISVELWILNFVYLASTNWSELLYLNIANIKFFPLQCLNLIKDVMADCDKNELETQLQVFLKLRSKLSLRLIGESFVSFSNFCLLQQKFFFKICAYLIKQYHKRDKPLPSVLMEPRDHWSPNLVLSWVVLPTTYTSSRVYKTQC